MKVEGAEGMDPSVSSSYQEVVSQISSSEGFQDFLKTPSFATLRSSASSAVKGPVIIINHSKRSHILILHDDAQSSPSVITTTDGFYDRAIELRDRLVRTRNNNFLLESKQYHRALRSVLEDLCELVGQPVVNELRRLKIPEQSRVWWCPTSVFCSLPLHAMGPFQSSDGVKRYFSDLYIPSYTSSLSALSESRKSSESPLEKPSVLLIANPDEYMKDAFPEIQLIHSLPTKVTTLIGEAAMPSTVLEGLQDHQFAHFVCRGNQEPGKPFDASFKLYGGNRLTLRDIIRSRLPPTTEFAFLPNCVAEPAKDIADEGLHLAAALQSNGFRSVVGTMWAMADEDGRDLAELFYKSLFSSDEQGVPYHQRSARSLRDAVRALRIKQSLPLERWVNFVHYGA